MEEPPEKELETVSFVVHATRGVIRDQRVRRKAMLVLLVLALLLVFAGATFLSELLNPHEHLGRFLFFWLACAWITLTAMLLAAFDLLVVRAEGRKAERALRQRFSDD